MRNNIYFLLGAPCSGKTTISSLLCGKHGMLNYSGDQHRSDLYKDIHKDQHPYMTSRRVKLRF